MKKFGKVLLSLVLLVLVSFGFCGCFEIKKTPISAEQFKTIMESRDYVVTDETSRMDDSSVDCAYLATYEDLVIHYYHFVSIYHAEAAYDDVYYDMKHEDGRKSSMEENGLNFEKYEIDGAGVFRVVCRIENTLVYTDAGVADASEAERLIEELGY